ncbi:hypothetical protein ACWGIU_37060, partial [Streptomyces sp. NPDC054840]
MTGRTSGPRPEPDERRTAGFGPPPAPFAPLARPAPPTPPAPPAPPALIAPQSGRRGHGHRPRLHRRPVVAAGAALALLATLLVIGGGAYHLTVRGGSAQPLAGPSGSPSV